MVVDRVGCGRCRVVGSGKFRVKYFGLVVWGARFHSVVLGSLHRWVKGMLSVVMDSCASGSGRDL